MDPVPTPDLGYDNHVLTDYIGAAMSKAEYEMVEGKGTFFGRIPPLDGVWANAARLEDCRRELAEVLEEWLLLRLSERLPIPELDGICLKVDREVA